MQKTLFVIILLLVIITSSLYFYKIINRYKKVLLIGNGPSILNKNLGHSIDKFDIVIRMNLATTKGYERHVGKKTTKRVVNGECMIRKYAQIPKDTKHIIVAEPHKNYFYQQLYKKHPSILISDLELLREYKDFPKSNLPTTGFITIYNLLKDHKHLHIIGFDFTNSHYYEHNNTSNRHNYEYEKKKIKEFIDSGRLIVL